LSVAHGLDQPKTALVGSEAPCPDRQRTKMSTQPSSITPRGRLQSGRETRVNPRDRDVISAQTIPAGSPEPIESFVDPGTAARYLQTTRRHVLEMVRAGLIVGHPLDPHAKKKDWRFLLSELHAYMLSCDQRPPGACKPPRRV
jgi:hypothetical protein